jgi:hypothetical protein
MIRQEVHDQALAVDSRWHVSRIKKIVRHRPPEPTTQTLTGTLGKEGHRVEESLNLQRLLLQRFLETQQPPPATMEEEEEESKEEEVPSPELELTSEISSTLVNLSDRAEYSNYKGSVSSSSSLKKPPSDKKKSSESSQVPGKVNAKASGSGEGSVKKESSELRNLSPSGSAASGPKPEVKLLESEGPDSTQDDDWVQPVTGTKSASSVFAHDGDSF